MLRIFVVDDELTIAFTLSTILNQSGFIAIPFTDPLQALGAAQVDGPDMIISDMYMPQLSGVDLALQIKELWPDCKVLLISGQPNTENLLREAHKKGHNFTILAKPVHPAELLRVIRDIENRTD